MFTVFAHSIGQASVSPLGLVAYAIIISSFTYLGYVKYLAGGKYDIRRRGSLDPADGLTPDAFIEHHLNRYRYLAYGATLVAIVILGAMTVDNLDREVAARIHAADVQRDAANIARVVAEGARDDANRARGIAERQVQATQAASDQQARDAQAAREQADRILQNQIAVAHEASELASQRLAQEKAFYDQQIAAANAQTNLAEKRLEAQIAQDQRVADAAIKRETEARAAARAPRWVTKAEQVPGCGESGCTHNQDICDPTPTGWKATGEYRNVTDSFGGAWGGINWQPTFRGGNHMMCMGVQQHSHNTAREFSFSYLIVPDDT